MTTLEQQVLEILDLNVRPCSSEAKSAKAHLPRRAVECATEDSLRAFLCVCHAVNAISAGCAISARTRGLLRTSTESIGLAWQEKTGRRREIQAVLLPTKQRWLGYVEAFLRGHHQTPVSAPATVNEPHLISGKPEQIDGKPNFHVVAQPSTELIRQLIDAYRSSSLT